MADVNNNVVSKVTGTNGSTLTLIKNKSGANLATMKPGQDPTLKDKPGHTKFLIIGAPQAVNMASKMIQEVLINGINQLLQMPDMPLTVPANYGLPATPSAGQGAYMQQQQPQHQYAAAATQQPQQQQRYGATATPYAAVPQQQQQQYAAAVTQQQPQQQQYHQMQQQQYAAASTSHLGGYGMQTPAAGNAGANPYGGGAAVGAQMGQAPASYDQYHMYSR